MASFPTSLATNSQLLVALDNAQTTLAAGINSSATSLSVVSAAAIASDTVVTIDSEQILLGTVVGTAASGCTRGYGGTTPASHSGGATVYANVIAAHHNRTRQELIAVQTALGAGMRFTRATVRTTAYNWSHTPTVGTTAGNAITLALSSFPDGLVLAGVNNHYLRITDAVGGAETVLVTGVVVGTSISFTPAITHAAGDWTIGSATAGIQEAIYATTSRIFHIPDGTHELYQQVFVPRRICVEGDGRYATKLNLNLTTQNGFASTAKGMQILDLEFNAVGTQTAGACISLTGSSVEAPGNGDIECRNCEFTNCYYGIYASWPGGFVRATNNMFRGVLKRAIHVFANVGYCAIQFVNNYADGRYADGIFWIEGALAGGVIGDNWFQKCGGAHVVVNNGGLVGELVICGNQIDQDDVCTAGIIVNGTGTESTSQNCVKIVGNYFNSGYYGVLLQDAFNIMVDSNRFRQNGNLPAIAVGGTILSQYIDISNNTIHCDAGASTYAIQLSCTTMSRITVDGNKGAANTLRTAFIGITGAVTDVSIKDNRPGINYGKLIADIGVTGAGEISCVGNNARNLAALAVTEAATITLPLADESQMISVTASGTAITEMNGVSARAGTRRTFVVGGIVNWATSSVADNKIGKAFGPTVAGQVVEFIKFTDNLWYPVR